MTYACMLVPTDSFVCLCLKLEINLKHSGDLAKVDSTGAEDDVQNLFL